ncbi:hypothetical protein GEU84_003400 [Fertoebacter nigrum]|uniref:Peptidase M41 domain-containing protein n=1 Tax=Fertoeibacter niger TaxID=2656921 RepID=A0A8X8GYB0_9RHOB|nr:hypothetical protein [Fertoeibacter niger]NUB43420.1 hypothetical protein [Fertoeibacter niger]
MPGPVAIERLLHHELGRDTPVDLAVVARAAAGKTPAEIVGAIRKAKAAARTGTLPLGTDQITAILKGKVVNLGPLAWRIAVHEAGHALYAHIAGMGEVMSMKIQGGGGEILLDRHANEGKVSDYENQIAYTLAGRAAEILTLGTPSAGAGGPANSDLAIATRLALQIERSTGLGRNGLVWEPDDYGGLIGQAERQSVSARLEAQAERANTLLEPHLQILENLARALLDCGHLSRKDIEYLLSGPDCAIRQASVAA